MLSREQWMEDTIKHTSRAFLATTVGCAKCHNHMYEPITQKEYYQLRAIFEPHEFGPIDSRVNWTFSRTGWYGFTMSPPIHRRGSTTAAMSAARIQIM